MIAPKLSLEVPGISVSSEAIEQTYVAHGYPEPYAQYPPPIVEPPEGADVIEEWEFFYGLSKRMDIDLVAYPIRAETGALRGRREAFAFDMERKPSTDEVLDGLMNGSRVPLDEIRTHPHGAIFDDVEIRVAPADPDCADRLDVGNADMMNELDDVRNEEAASEEAYPFRLISRRLPNVYNSSGRDIDRLNGRKPWNPAFLHPDDVASLGLARGDLVEIRSPRASIVGIVEPARDVRPGVISMAHCFGETPSEEDAVDDAARALGANTSRLVDNEDVFDPHTGIPRMSAIPVAVERRD